MSSLVIFLPAKYMPCARVWWTWSWLPCYARKIAVFCHHENPLSVPCCSWFYQGLVTTVTLSAGSHVLFKLLFFVVVVYFTSLLKSWKSVHQSSTCFTWYLRHHQSWLNISLLWYWRQKKLLWWRYTVHVNFSLIWTSINNTLELICTTRCIARPIRPKQFVKQWLKGSYSWWTAHHQYYY